MPKEMPMCVYVYYGCEHELPEWARELLEKAKKILGEKMCSILGEDVACSRIPYNVIKVCKDGKVTFSWYRDFWTDDRPRLEYYITVNTRTGEVKVTTPSRVRRSPVAPLDYIHGKEEFVEGLEEKVVNPYGNWKSLRWDAKARRDVWKPLFLGERKRIRELVSRLRRLADELERRYL
ncbi:MAG: hypothetical protein DRJ40_08025 [Thermoprotei archaeon]|nr:MAG: hypothetical protein DRJ40_08025 [Thermoprotei archaeon]